MKILMLADSMVRGGTERRLTELLKALSANSEFSVELVVFSNKILFDELFALQIPVHIIERKRKKDFTPVIHLYKLCRKIKPDIIHCWGSMASLFALPVRILQRPVFINSIITDAPYKMNLFDKRLFRFKITAPFSDVILANSQAGLKSYNAPTSKSRVIYNGFDFNRISTLPADDKTRLKWNIPKAKIVGMVGAFEPRKDYETFVNIGNHILLLRPDVVFLAVGDGSLRSSMEKMVHPSVKSRFIFTGNTAEVEELMQLFDIGVLISNRKIHGEGISNSIMEYMALRKPVIANDNGGNSEIISTDNTGYIIADHDMESWYSKIIYLLDHPDRASAMGTRAYERVKRLFNIKDMVGSFVDLYHEMDNRKIKSLTVSHQDQG